MSNKIKVLFFLPNLNAGGAERILVTLMNNIDNEAFAPIFLTLNDSGPITSWINNDIPFHSFKNRTVTTSIVKMFFFIKKHRPDVIFTTMAHSNALALIMKIIFPQIRVIIREAALPSALIYNYGIKGRACIFIYKLLYGFADRVISNCSQMIEDFQKIVKIKTNNHSILFNPVDTERIFNSLPQVFENIDNHEKTLFFAAIGRLSFEKGYDRLFKALKNFTPPFNWRLDIVGEGNYRPTLEKLILDYSLHEHVFLHGYKTNPWAICASADCLLLPSRWEGMPNVVLEGFAFGVPTIAMTEAGGIQDIKKYISEKHLKIVDTIEDFVEEMNFVSINPKSSKKPSLLPSTFHLKTIIHQFEAILRG